MQTIINLFKMLRVLGQFQPETTPDGLRLVHGPTGCSVTFRNDGSLITWAPKNNLPQAGEVLMLNCRDEYVNRLTRKQLEARDVELARHRQEADETRAKALAAEEAHKDRWVEEMRRVSVINA